MTPRIDALCLAAAAAGKVVLWDGRALSVALHPARRAAIDAAIARAKGGGR